MGSFQVMALTPPGLLDPAIAIAASRAGAIGLLDLEYVRDLQAARAALARLTHYGRHGCGVKLDGRVDEVITHVIAELPASVTVVILTPGDLPNLQTQLDALRRTQHRHLTILLEATSLEEASLGEALRVDGLIAKGHEAGGRVGEETTFVLLQRLLAHTSHPVFAQGGIGLHTASACYAAGAAGVVLDTQLTLTRESTIPSAVKRAIARMDGSETVCLGEELGEAYRIYAGPGSRLSEALRQVAKSLTQAEDRPRAERLAAWRQAVRERVGWEAPECAAWLIGQDAAFAAPLAERFRTVGGVIEGMREAIGTHIRAAQASRPLDEGSPLAQSHRTRYPIVQGPMTRVSDRAPFAAYVAEGGALPFLALALMRGPEVRTLLRETSQLLGSRPWGVGILGFVPHDLMQEQLEVIREERPPFALIAGGRPDQARSLEEQGIPTYLHVPSPGLLKLFLDEGARRFVFEGRECGGHVGPRTSFVLWDIMVEVLLEKLSAVKDAEQCHVLFAGGIHDALSSAMVATLAAPLVEHGVKVGVLMGTAYLITQEAVSSGAIVKGFQDEAIRCKRTILLETGPGHATRCADTPYGRTFCAERHRLLAQGLHAEEIRETLERMNLGRLRLASKGITRASHTSHDTTAPRHVTVPDEQQRIEGMYMIGQVAVLRERVSTITQLHHEVAVESSDLLRRITEESVESPAIVRKERPSGVAIIGMGCVLPKAPGVRQYWANIVSKVNAITEVPPNRWDWRLYYDPDPAARDRVNSKWGGFVDEIPFDPTRYGIPPAALSSIEPMQLLTLEVVRAALEDAGYADRDFDRERTSVILGVGGGVGDLGSQYIFRSALPLHHKNGELIDFHGLPEWTEDSFPGILLNVMAGRVANCFNFGGVNFTVDAACASSLAAVYLAVRELEDGNSNMVIVGGADNVQSPFAYLCFAKSRALSPRGQCRAFDEGADGIVISEGVAVLVMKRLEDAERDGDRIYAVIKGIGGSSDGRGRGLTAPRSEGQLRALDRAYGKAGFSPATLGLIEAHGTGTVAGDSVEGETLIRLLSLAGAAPKACAVGSVKSMIGHTKCAAGVAGLIKVALALYDKVLPPTMNVERPNAKICFAESPLYVNTESRPWLAPHDHPRRAAVSAFGFGGTNFHVALEEYTGDYPQTLPAARPIPWPGELFYWASESRQAVEKDLEDLERALDRDAEPEFAALAAAVWRSTQSRLSAGKECRVRLAIVASSLADLRAKITKARTRWVGDPAGVYVGELSQESPGRVAFLFPGQGSQYPDMLRGLAVYLPEIRERFELADRVLARRFPRSLSAYVFPVPQFSEEEEQAAQRELAQTNVAQSALGVAGVALFNLYRQFGIVPEMVAGHSYGEYIALHVAGAFSEETLYQLSEARGRMIIEVAEGRELGTMAAVAADPDAVQEVIGSLAMVSIANLNAPCQTVISGTNAGIDQAIKRLKARGIEARHLAVSCGFHSPLVEPARKRFAEYLATVQVCALGIEVYSNTTGTVHPNEPRRIAETLADHLVRPVKFQTEIEAMYSAGARIFVEVGPRSVLANLTREILRDRPHWALASDISGKDGIVQLQRVLAELAVLGIPVNLSRLFQGRVTMEIDLASLDRKTALPSHSETAWMVSAAQIRQVASSTASITNSLTKQPRVQQSHAEREGRDQSGSAAEPSSEVGPPSDMRGPESQRLPGFSEVTFSSASNGGIAAAKAPTADPGDPVILQFQNLMSRFLDTQRQIMLTYLHGGGGNASVAPSDSSASPAMRMPSEGSDSRLVEPMPREPIVRAAEQPGRAEPEPPEPALEPIPKVQGADRQRLQETLVRLVADRTGYPPDMLGMDLDLEADLGIDSIKRVEILGAFRRECGLAHQRDLQEAMERFIKLKTLRQIVDVATTILVGSGMDDSTVEAARAAQVADQTSAPPRTEGADPAKAEDAPVPRFLLKAVKTPPSTNMALPLSGQVILVTDDGHGVAHVVEQTLTAKGAKVLTVCLGETYEALGAGRYRTPLSDPTRVEQFIGEVRQEYGRIAGVIHLLPLREAGAFQQLSLSQWRARIHFEVKSLFYLAKNVAQDLKTSVQSGQAWFIAATGMGGTFLTAPTQAKCSPHQAGIAGLVKTLAAEWPGVRCRVVDLDPGEPPERLAAWIVSEMGVADPTVEVGYASGERVMLRPYRAALDAKSERQIEIDSRSVILVTGGARGISAEVALELAQRFRPVLILLGLTPYPQEAESEDTRHLTKPQALKSVILERLRRSGEVAGPSQIEAAYGRLLREREIRATLDALRSAGSSVEYVQVDVRDGAALQAVVEGVYRRYGRIDGVISAAGLIEDKLIEHKTSESLDRVLDTKADAAYLLAYLLKPERLSFLVFFSSVAGAFGNPGQADYAAANEILNKMAIVLDRLWPCRVASLNWGPWAKGMASLGVQRLFKERGVQVIAPASGRRLFVDELLYGPKGDVSVILGDGPWGKSADEDPNYAGQEEAPGVGVFPLLRGVSLATGPGGALEGVCTFDPSVDPYLRDHLVDGKPVVPFTVAMELMAEAVQAVWPEWQVVGLRDVSLHRGIILDGGAKPVRLVVRSSTGPHYERIGVDVTVELRDLEQPAVLYYRGTVELSDRLPTVSVSGAPTNGQLAPYPKPLLEAYRDWLFHGPLFQRITTIEGVSQDLIVAQLHTGGSVATERPATWLLDPLLLDCVPQLVILWARAFLDITPLPTRLSRYIRYAPLPTGSLRCVIKILPGPDDGASIRATAYFVEDGGRLVGLIEGLEAIGSQALNRLVGSCSRQRVRT